VTSNAVKIKMLIIKKFGNCYLQVALCVSQQPLLRDSVTWR